MNTIIKYIQFPFVFSVETLTEELHALSARWVAHFNKAHYDGAWSALPLRAVDGSMDNIIPEHSGQAEFRDTALMAQCPYIKSIVEHFRCGHKAVRLLKLGPGAVIREHTDKGLCFEMGEARIHVPVATNEQVEFYLDNERVVMQPGTCWYMNFDLPHRIANYGSTDRVHLVIDILVNDSIRELFASAGNKKVIEAKDPFSAGERKEMIKRLREMNTPVSLRIAEEMEL